MPTTPAPARRGFAARAAALGTLAVLAAAGIGTWPGRAGATVGDELPGPAARALGGRAHLVGEGRFTWLGLHVYDARLWAAAPALDTRRLGTEPLALELTYARSLAGQAIARRSVREIEALGYGDAETREQWLTAMLQLFPDVAAGDRLLGAFHPAQGTLFLRNGQPLGAVPGSAFAQAFFAIWLDPRTTAPGLRERLLRGVASARGDAR